MIIIDTHIWIWWVLDEKLLSQNQVQSISQNEESGIGISSISIWEIAKSVELGKLELPCTLEEWFEKALSYPGIQVIEITPEIAIESTHLPGEFHKDPADQIIVASARYLKCPLVTSDEKILQYKQVESVR